MLINPYAPDSRELLAPIPGTRIVAATLGVVGHTVRDPLNMIREWTIQALYVPARGRKLGGIRAKMVDQKNFISFCNQRDLEILLDLASPGAYCQWLGQDYADPSDAGWFGLCVDEDDLLDDLYDRELEARAMYQEDAVLPAGLSFDRRIHGGIRNDYVEHMLLLSDVDPYTGLGPDMNFETVERRWASVERTRPGERSYLWDRL